MCCRSVAISDHGDVINQDAAPYTNGLVIAADVEHHSAALRPASVQAKAVGKSSTFVPRRPRGKRMGVPFV
jgi:hypothetical protein